MERSELLAMMSDESWNQVLDTNLGGAFRLTREVLRGGMVHRRRGAIVNVASLSALHGVAGHTAYAASKGAVRSLTRTAAVQYAPSGIRINSVFPGFVETPMTRELHGRPGVREKRTRRTLLGRLATPRDIAWGILFLACDESAYMTGAELVIDGGVTAH